MKTNPNDTTFAYGTDNYDHKGLTKREHFAALAMQGLCACGANDFNFDHVERIAKIAIAQSDALIAELNRTQDYLPTNGINESI